MKTHRSFLTIAILAIVLPMSVSATTNDDLQALITKLQAQLAVLVAQYNASFPTIGPASDATACVRLRNTLTIGSTDANADGEVSVLQEFLMGQGTASDPVYPERLVTGFFGSATSRAVQKRQSIHGIPLTTVGVAVVGPKTIVAMTSGCNKFQLQASKVGNPAHGSYDFEAKPLSGQSPLLVTFGFHGKFNVGAYGISDPYVYIDFGDGLTSEKVQKTVCPGDDCYFASTHTYRIPGTYTAFLFSTGQSAKGDNGQIVSRKNLANIQIVVK